jgi:hypothetical protein
MRTLLLITIARMSMLLCEQEQRNDRDWPEVRRAAMPSPRRVLDCAMTPEPVARTPQ